MRIGIVTQPLRYNYGGILQNYALQTVLKRMGHEVITLDGEVKVRQTAKRRVTELVKKILIALRDVDGRVLGIWKYQNSNEILSCNTSQFINKYINVRKLKKHIEPEFDALIVGSDQVWRPEFSNLDEAFLEFAEDWDVLRLSYAASFGLDSITLTPMEIGKYGRLLKMFNAISVRERSGIDICNNIFNVEAELVLDPTLLLTSSDYINNLKIEDVEHSEGDIFYYFLDKNQYKQHIVSMAHLYIDKKVFTVNSDVEDLNAPINKRIQPPIEKWLRAFYDATFVITDSFHGCVFSIIFNKPFVLIANKHRGLARFTSLFEQLGIHDRIIEEGCPVSVDKYLEAPCVDIVELKKQSLDFLNMYL